MTQRSDAVRTLDAPPAADITELLYRRTDLSTFLVHFTRDFETAPARVNLVSILRSRTIEARTVHGMLREHSEDNEDIAATQRSVCFTETPLEHAWMMCRQIANRQHQFAPYGVAFPKAWARRKGVNPVWYMDITPGHDFLTKPINELIELAASNEARAFVPDGRGEQVVQRVPLHRSQVAKVAPFIEMMGTHNGSTSYRKEFWWEREWRKVGPLSFAWSEVLAIFAPDSDHASLTSILASDQNGESRVPPLLDPEWGMERMIASLRGLRRADSGPLP